MKIPPRFRYFVNVWNSGKIYMVRIPEFLQNRGSWIFRNFRNSVSELPFAQFARVRKLWLNSACKSFLGVGVVVVHRAHFPTVLYSAPTPRRAWPSQEGVFCKRAGLFFHLTQARPFLSSDFKANDVKWPILTLGFFVKIASREFKGDFAPGECGRGRIVANWQMSFGVLGRLQGSRRRVAVFSVAFLVCKARKFPLRSMHN